MSFISQVLIDQTSAGTSLTTKSEVSAFQQKIRQLLNGYDTFLQGSYANDTAISDINDVDIVALEVPVGLGSINATTLFNDIKSRIETDYNYIGNTIINKKCLSINLSTKKADIVPAIKGILAVNKNYYGEPIFIADGIANYPKTHINNGISKNKRTNDNYKKIVRMLKHFVNNHNIKNIALSFYLECLIYSYHNCFFTNDLPLSLSIILRRLNSSLFNPNFRTVAGDKYVISQTEWHPQVFAQFKNLVSCLLPHLIASLTAKNEQTANYYYRRFFNINI
jgi:hypothetical protein